MVFLYCFSGEKKKRDLHSLSFDMVEHTGIEPVTS